MPASKEEIAAAFGELALRYGYRRASVDDVARALHISKQTIYEHFGSKEGLYRASVELWATQQRQSVEARLTETSALGRIVEVTKIAFADARRGFEANPHQEAGEPPEIVAEVNARVFGPMVQDLIVQGNQAGEFHVDDPETTAAFAMAIGMEAVRMLRADPSSTAPEAAVDALRRLVAGGVERKKHR
ncbi:MAG: TetR/AcrR family transcriptional regulator [Thermoleophilia bacterium]|nr:TetR/AcrR family transcriptional regulator [Thermoleophilia bacterium]